MVLQWNCGRKKAVTINASARLPFQTVGTQPMIWIILTVVVVFLIASAMPLIRQNTYERKQRQAIADHSFEDIESSQHLGDDEDGHRL
jgi:hypothetical protein